jgi:hypothetical protein
MPGTALMARCSSRRLCPRNIQFKEFCDERLACRCAVRR